MGHVSCSLHIFRSPAQVKIMRNPTKNGAKWFSGKINGGIVQQGELMTPDYLVGGIPNALKNMSSSVGMMTFPMYGKIKAMFQTTNQSLVINNLDSVGKTIINHPFGNGLHHLYAQKNYW